MSAMRSLCWFALASGISCPAISAGIRNLPDPHPFARYDIKGTIGKHAIHMRLDRSVLYRCGEGDQDAAMVGTYYSGWYEYVGIGKHIALQGAYDSQGVNGAVPHPPLEIREMVDGEVTGYFETTEDEFESGYWYAGGERALKLRYSFDTISDELSTDTPMEDLSSTICQPGVAGKQE